MIFEELILNYLILLKRDQGSSQILLVWLIQGLILGLKSIFMIFNFWQNSTIFGQFDVWVIISR